MKNKAEYLKDHPDREWIFKIPRINGKIWMCCEDPECKNPGVPKLVYPKDIAHDQCGDGLYRCLSCGHRKQKETMGPEGIRASLEKQRETMGIEGLTAAAVKRYNTMLENGVFMRSYLETQIESLYGGQHSAPEFLYELDCYWPDLHLGIEVDDPSHFEGRDKRVGYHREKDDYFKSLGITVLHLTFNRPNWREEVKQFLEGTYTGPLIDITDPTYGNIVY